MYLISVLSVQPSIELLEHVVLPVESDIDTALYEAKRSVAHVASDSPDAMDPGQIKSQSRDFLYIGIARCICNTYIILQ